MSLTTCCGVRVPEELELEELELEELLLEVEELATPDELLLEVDELETPEEPLLEVDELLEPPLPVSPVPEPQAIAPREAQTNPHENRYRMFSPSFNGLRDLSTRIWNGTRT